MKNVIKLISSGSVLAGRAEPGWELISVNGHEIKDVLDYKFYTYERKLKILFKRPDGKEKTVRIRKQEGEDLGLDFEDYLMDVPRSCANNCVFCFIDQNPPGMRKSIYFKDDDARLSFLMGCYITLTNLSEREIERIIALRVSPVNVSVHTTDPELRVQMLKNRFAGKCYEIMQKLAANDIVMNCQIVACPGINDGEALLRTLSDLKALYPAVHSISVVPLGMTAHRQGLPELKPYTAESASVLLDSVNAFGDECLRELGTRLVFCSDEFYLKSGRPLPEDSFYEEHTQLENGVGMLRLLEKEFMMALDFADEPRIKSFSIATGEAAFHLISDLAMAFKKKYPDITYNVYPIKNSFYGGGVTVTGLITGGDLIESLKGRKLGERLLISSDMLRRDEKDFLDSITLAEAEEKLGVPIIPVISDGGELVDAMLGAGENLPEGYGITEETDFNKYNPPRKRG